MAQTVIGFFDDHSDAQRAVERLQSSGFSRERIDVSRGSRGVSGAAHSNLGHTASGSSTGTASPNPVSGSTRDENSVRTTEEGRTVDREGRNTNKITDFVNNLFGGSDDKDDVGRFSHVAQNSNAIVTVHTQSDAEAERAADILDDCGAVDVDERASQSGFTNTRSTESTSEGQSMAAGSGRERMRSRIINRPVEDNFRLREDDFGGTSDYTGGQNPSGNNQGSRNTDVD